MVGLVGLGTGASAEPGFVPPDEEATTSLTLHKHVQDPESEAGQPAGDPLAGVTFSVQEIGVLVGTPGVCTAIDLGTPQGWQQVTAAITDFGDGRLANPYCDLGTALTAGPTNSQGEVTLNGVWGLYLVTETDSGPNMISGPAAPFLVTVPYPTAPNSWDYTVDAYPKNVLTTVTPTKTVAENNTGTPLVPGATVHWTVTVPIPEAAFPYNTITIDDNAGAGMTFAAFGTMELNGTALTEGTAGPPETGDYYVSNAGVESDSSLLTLTAAGLAKVNAIAADGNGATTATLVVNLTTTVNIGITPGYFGNMADVTLNGQTTTTPEPKTYWGKLIVNKVVEGETTPSLAGAQFVVYEPNGADGTCAAYVAGTTPIVATGTTDVTGVWSQVLWIANANADVTGPLSKDYCLVETVAPANYILDSTPRTITLTWNYDTNHTTSYNFPNTPPEGPQLPLTGAGGTMALTLAGLALVGFGSGGILLSRRRRTEARSAE